MGQNYKGTSAAGPINDFPRCPMPPAGSPSHPPDPSASATADHLPARTPPETAERNNTAARGRSTRPAARATSRQLCEAPAKAARQLHLLPDRTREVSRHPAMQGPLFFVQRLQIAADGSRRGRESGRHQDYGKKTRHDRSLRLQAHLKSTTISHATVKA